MLWIERRTTWGNWVMLVLCFAVCFSAAALGALFPPDAWFAAIVKPSWQPPNWLFGPVWTVLYALMSVALWRLWTKENSPARATALVLFAAQLTLNALWSPVFFGAHAIGAALVIIVLLDALVIATIYAFARVDQWAACLLIPYLGWISFATALNGALWILN